MNHPTRRAVLTTGVAAVAAGLAGCSAPRSGSGATDGTDDTDGDTDGEASERPPAAGRADAITAAVDPAGDAGAMVANDTSFSDGDCENRAIVVVSNALGDRLDASVEELQVTGGESSPQVLVTLTVRRPSNRSDADRSPVDYETLRDATPASVDLTSDDETVCTVDVLVEQVVREE
ncbi:hypothetical protein [Halomarina ordinaria]|uniref:Twin-arginine translocation signal domain-containing protein n=1 Tax=Halomarina ordinaria TaxID=3033939 RepID=A0ABD5UF20_9EURY|nr:hypothetical protein [Halomarina sp. PSRA2]